MEDASHKTGPLQILIVDDEVNIRKTLSICLETEGHQVVGVSNAVDALEEANRRSFDLALVDLRLGTTSGLDLIPVLLASSPWLKVVVITAYATVETAVEAVKRGATDYLPKPFTPAQVNLVVRKVAEVRSLERKVADLQEMLGREHPGVEMESNSPVMQRAIGLARQVAASDVTVLIRGESGTGKTLLARAIHAWSRRADKPFGVVSCPALPSELLESELFGHAKGAFTGAVRDHAGRIFACQGGTLFLDEVGDLPLPLQPKLLRFLQERVYERIGESVTHQADVRILAATSTDMERAATEGRFRQDLLYRLNVIQIELPPLRQRPEDIVSMASRLLAFFGAQNRKRFLGFTDDALSAVRSHTWPGNVRELRNVVERAAILCPCEYVGVEHLPEEITPSAQSPQVGGPVSLDVIEQAHIRRVLASTKSLEEAAALLGIDPATLWRKRKKYGI